MINKPPPLNRDYNRDPNIKALKRRGFINHGSTLSSLAPYASGIDEEEPAAKLELTCALCRAKCLGFWFRAWGLGVRV